MPFDSRKKELTFYFFGGTPIHFSLTKCCFWTADKIQRELKKMK